MSDAVAAEGQDAVSRSFEPVRLSDYRPPDHLIDTIDLVFHLEPTATRVMARMAVRRNPAGTAPADAPLVLDGDADSLTLTSIRLDGEPLDENRYVTDDSSLTVQDVPETFVLDIETRIDPQANTELSGLYRSGGIYCTQCEAQGFRRITYYPDRPDVLAVFTVTLMGDRSSCPLLLSNGNPVDRGDAGPDRHWATWHDPHPKPAYLFALVAGDLATLTDTYTTRSGRAVTLNIHVLPRDADKSAFALEALKKSMKWDEDRFGLEYDLDVYSIVAVPDFNMGAMENKGLNVFNTKYVLARPDTATDSDYHGVESVIAHEYFHNWTGNRVTLRDWFQLSLKEGLTVWRDQEFSSDTGSRAVERIKAVRRLRSVQFPEDAGPTAHPIRPDSYIEINNFYTPTVYEKGAEVVRMLHTLIGDDAFTRGLKLYLERHDNGAATVEDWLAAMQEVSGADLSHFKLWYEQAGTPRIGVEESHDAANRQLTLTITQETAPTPGQPDKRPLHIPFSIGLLDPSGRPLPVTIDGDAANAERETAVVSLTRARQTVVLNDVPENAAVSLLRGFSAPVNLAPRGRERLLFLMAHDPDTFSRWDAGQDLMSGILIDHAATIRDGGTADLDDRVIEAVERIVSDETLDPALVAEMLVLPSETDLAQHIRPIPVEAIHAARTGARSRIAARLRDRLVSRYQALGGPSADANLDAAQMARRALKNTILALLNADTTDATGRDLAAAQAENATTMTDSIAALIALNETDGPQRDRHQAEFLDRWRDEALVVDKWFSLQAMRLSPATVEAVSALRGHDLYARTNPNRVRSLIGVFAAANPVAFHRQDGAGHRLLAEEIKAINRANPQLAAALTKPLTRWQHHDATRAESMKSALRDISAIPDLSRNVFELVKRGLDDADANGDARPPA
ncbi:aminopeptidase N [Fodinicurvata sp. EGI_FJ10296]|uniref:aminopeptidase N n=1 Tax=Fodinicurvata sp. EGI_FJ10296 TaxID=3231908 RepID=UPI00345379F9